MKRLSIITFAAILLCSCSSQLTEQDYKDALTDYVENNYQQKIAQDGITLRLIQNVTVNDSLEYLNHTLSQEYSDILAGKKQAWEEKQADCEKDEKANLLRHEDYMKKYNDAKRKYGNDIKYKNKIEGYLKAAEKLPSNHEEYLEFDRRRSYSFTRDAENLKADYEQFLQQGANDWVAQHPLYAAYDGRDKNEVLALAYYAEYQTTDGETLCGNYLFNNKPLSVEELPDETANITNYKQAENTPTESSEEQ